MGLLLEMVDNFRFLDPWMQTGWSLEHSAALGKHGWRVLGAPLETWEPNCWHKPADIASTSSRFLRETR